MFFDDGVNGKRIPFLFWSSWLIVVVLDIRVAAEYRQPHDMVDVIVFIIFFPCTDCR